MEISPMLRPLRLIEARVLPRGWKDLIRQILLFAGAFLLYDLVRSLADPSAGQYKPFGDAMKIIDLERTLHIFIEPSVQAWAMNMHWLMDGLDWIYLNGHFFVTLAVLGFIYFRRNKSFYFVRNTVMIAMALAPDRLRAVSDGTAATDARMGLHRLDLPIRHRRHRLGR